MLRIKLLGGVSIEGDAGPLTGPEARRHRLALLALLSIAYPRAMSRDRLVAYLWPESDAERGRNLLNQAVHALRRALGPGLLLSAGDEVRLETGEVGCDVVEFEAALAAGELERAVGLYRGPFLDGFFLSGAARFEHWVDGERERLRQEYSKALEGLADAATARGDAKGAVEWWRRVSGEEPFNARSTLRLMEALKAAGDRAGAIQQARLHTVLLHQEFDAEPDDAVCALAERLRREGSGSNGDPDLERRLEENGARTSDTPRPAIADPDATLHEEGAAAVEALPPRRAPRYAVALAVAGVILLSGWMTLGLLRSSSPPLHSQRVVVPQFENRTSDPALDPIGIMAADWITQGLSHTAAVDVVASSAALASARHVRDAISANAALDPIRALAEETGAGLVVSGAYYRSGDSLLFQVQITDARERRLLRALDAVTGAVDSPIPAIELLRQRTLGALASLLDSRLAAHAQHASLPPSYEAYRAYAEAMEIVIAGRWQDAIVQLERALVLDSTFILPRLVMGIALVNLGAYSAADSIGRELNRFREHLAPYDRALLDLMVTWLGDDPIAPYEAAKRAAALAPASLPHVQWGIQAVRLNRPREAIEILSQIDPTRGEVRGWAAYWSALTEAYHLLGEHGRELKEARRATALYPHDPHFLWLESRALVALGRLGELDRVIDSRMSLPEEAYPNPGLVIRLVGNELQAHGHEAAAQRMYERSIAWHRARPASEQAGHRASLAYTLLAAGRWQEAEAMYVELAAANPAEVSYHGALGVLAAQRGDSGEAERISAWLAGVRLTYQRGAPTYWRAGIAAHLDSKAEATALMREAFGQGMRHAYFPHMSSVLVPLRDYPPFQELLRPAG